MGLEHLSLSATPSGVVARAAVIGERDAAGFGAFYEIHLSAGWQVDRFRIETAGGARLSLSQDEPGRWTADDGTHRADLDGCIDIDLAGTPFTNTLPIRRLDGQLTTPTELRMLYVPFDTFEPLVDAQRYTELSPHLYRYEAMDGTFAADLPVDEDGLVIDYPMLFRRV